MSTYSLPSYAGMLGDPVRIRAYREALKQVVKPESVVLDLGAGFGYFALVACQLGARRVYAIEPAESIDLLPELAKANGFADRIVAIRELSTKVTLPERADVIVSDIRGSLPTIAGSLRSMMDARERLLAPGGVLMPRRDTLFVAPVDDRGAAIARLRPWSGADAAYQAEAPLDLRPVERLLANRWNALTVKSESLLALPQVWSEIDYHQLRSPHLEGQAEFTIQNAGTLHGFSAWFEAEPIEGIRYSTGPGALPTVYGTAFMIMQEPQPVRPGDTLRVRILCHDTGPDYTLRWQTTLVRDGVTLASFDQSTFHSHIITLQKLKGRLPNHVPALKEEAEIARCVLNGASDKRSLGEIARDLRERFAGRFETDAAAVDHAAGLLEKLNG